MPGRLRARTNIQKIAIFRRRFTGLPNVYGTYDPETGRVRQVKQPVTDAVIWSHLVGKRSYGVYLLVADRTSAVVTDFDDPDPLGPVECVRQARHYGLSAYIERSKSKGFHVWIFFGQDGVLARHARAVMQLVLDEIGRPETEIFPKQDSLRNGATYGNFINAPLFGRLVPQQRSVFVDPMSGLRPYPNQWDVLECVDVVSERELAEIVEVNSLDQTCRSSEPPQHDSHRPHDLPPCAVRMFQGVSRNQRVVCFRLAAHLHRLGIPQDIAVVTLKAWAAQNRPTDGKGAQQNKVYVLCLRRIVGLIV